MKRNLFISLALSTGLLCSQYSSSQNQTSFTTFDYKTNLINTRYKNMINKNVYHQCGIGPQTLGIPDAPPTIEVFPEYISTHVGDPVELRFDASTICYGQTVADSTNIEYGNQGMHPIGSIEFEPGIVLAFREMYGIGTFVTGYSQPRSGSVVISFDLRCKVPRADWSCKVSRSIPISIVAKDKPLNKLTATPTATIKVGPALQHH
jgi:hypothetical protein